MKKALAMKFMALSVAVSLTVSLAACGTKGNDTGTTPAGSTTTAAATETVKPADPLGKYEEPIVLKRVLETVAGEKFYEGETYEDNIWTREIENTLGIKFETMWQADTSQYKQKLDLTIASGDLPDFFHINNDIRTFSNCQSSGLLAPLNEAYEQYASEDFKKLQDVFPQGMESSTVDGKLYAIPDVGGTAGLNASVLWIRDDWMKKFNLSAPKTMEELVNMAKIFATQDPDGNNKQDTFGLALQKDLYGFAGEIKGFAAGYHAFAGNTGNNMWVKDASGQLVYGAIQPEMKNALKALQDMYKDGLIDKEFGVKDVNKVFEDISNNKIGITYGIDWLSYWPFNDMVKKDKNAVWKPYPVPSADGTPAKLGVPWPVSKYYVVSKNCKNPEALLKMANLFLVKAGMKATLEDKHKFDVSPEGISAYKFHPISMAMPGREFDQSRVIEDVLKNPDKASSLSAFYRQPYDNVKKWVDGDPAGYGEWGLLGPEGSAKVIDQNYVQQDRIVVNASKGNDTPTMIEKGTTLATMEQEVFTKIIMGSSLDEFDKFVADWKNLGGDTITKELNDLYAK